MSARTRPVASVTALAAAILFSLPAGASAAKIAVGTTADEYGTPKLCSLREAVQTANSNAAFGGCVPAGAGAKDTILLEGGETYTRSIDGDFEDANTSGDLDITGKTVIKVKGDGPATIDGNDMDRVIDLRTGSSLTASDLIVTDGQQAPNTFTGHTGGGGIRVEFDAALELSSSEISFNETLGTGGSPNGGGLDTIGDVVLRQVTLAQNSSSQVGGAIAFIGGKLTVLRSTLTTNSADDFGGGIYLAGQEDESFKLVRSTLTQNHAHETSLDGGGGGIYANSGSEADRRIVNSTISTNYSDRHGGGVFAAGGGSLRVNATTITGNYADYEELGNGTGGGVAGGGATYKNSIIADNFNPLVIGNEEDCASFSPSLGGTHNLVGMDTGCTTTGNVVAANPKLDPLADNGGPTQTHKLQAGSKAIGKAGNSAPAKDQRGQKRDAQPDIGAYER